MLFLSYLFAEGSPKKQPYSLKQRVENVKFMRTDIGGCILETLTSGIKKLPLGSL